MCKVHIGRLWESVQRGLKFSSVSNAVFKYRWCPHNTCKTKQQWTKTMVIASTKCQHKIKHKITWTSRDKGTENQIDHILIVKRDRHYARRMNLQGSLCRCSKYARLISHQLLTFISQALLILLNTLHILYSGELAKTLLLVLEK